MEKYRRIFEVRGLLMAPPVLFLLFVTLGEYEREWVIMPAGFALFTIGVAIRIWAQMHLHYRLSVKKTLTTTGPYRFIRNPIYVANTTMLAGLTVMSELLWFVPLMLIWCAVVYHFVVQYEEGHLAAKYGEPYREYLRTTPRWLPRFSPATESARQAMGRFLKPSIVAELHCFLLVVPFVIKELIAD